jgi:TonB family protein
VSNWWFELEESVMTSAALLYQPRHGWRVAIAFGAALLIHFVAIALANVHRVEKSGGLPFNHEFTSITFEDSPPTADLAPEDPDPLPIPARTEESFPEEESTPSPIRRATGKSIAPLVKRRNQGPANPGPWSSAKALAINAPRPEYPYEARRQKITGEGMVALTVDSVTGKVSGVSMSKSTGSPFLDNAALSGFRRWRFKPGTVSSVTCPITFTLTGASY